MCYDKHAIGLGQIVGPARTHSKPRCAKNFHARRSIAKLLNYRRDQLLLGSVTYPLPVGMRKRPSWSRQPCSKPSWILLSTWQLAQSSSTGPSQYLLPLMFFPQFLEPFP